MDKLVYLLPVLGCIAMMTVMMLMMHTGHGAAESQPEPTTRDEIAALRAEIAVLRSRPTTSPATVDSDGGPSGAAAD